MNIFRTFTFVLISFFPLHSFADGLSCIGMDGSGQTIKLIFDVDTASINVNGNILKIAGGSKDGKTVWTQDYLTDKGVLAKGLLTHKEVGDDNVTFKQVTTKKSEVIAVVPLACKRINS